MNLIKPLQGMKVNESTPLQRQEIFALLTEKGLTYNRNPDTDKERLIKNGFYYTSLWECFVIATKTDRRIDNIPYQDFKTLIQSL